MSSKSVDYKNIRFEPKVKGLSEDEIKQYQHILDTKDPVAAYYFLLNNPFVDSKPIFNLIKESDDPRVLYETALNIPDAPIDDFYKRIKELKNYFFKTLFELEILN